MIVRSLTWRLMIGGLAWCIGSMATAEPIPPAWTCLPESTVIVARIPSGQAFASALVERTKLGAVLMNPQRLDKIATMIREGDEGDWEQFVEELAKYKLKPDDAKQLFVGEAGAAMAIEVGDTPVFTVLGFAWIEPGEDTADRLYAALQQAIDEDIDAGFAKRSDIELAGVSVMQLTTPDTTISPYFVARLGKRIVLALGAQSAALGAELPDVAELSERVQNAFGRFIDAQRSSQSAEPPRMMQAPGLTAALPGGVPLLEVMADPRPLVRIFIDFAAKAKEEDRASAERSAKLVKALALDTLGPLAYRAALDGNALRTGLFLGAAEPRTGLASLLDQKPLAAEPPAWVANSVVSYEHLSFDVGKAYVLVRQLVIEQLGDPAKAAFDLIESQVRRNVDIDLDLLLSSLGQRHSAITFPAKVDDARLIDEDAVSATNGRSALVWQIGEEAAWRRVLQFACAAMGQEPVEEQGFLGLRINHASFQGGVFLGREFLVVGVGADVLEQVLAMLRNPPPESESLRASQLLRQASDLLSPTSGLTYQINDNNRNFRAARQVLVTSLEKLRDHEPKAGEDAATTSPITRARMEAILGLIPSDDELDGTFGVGASQSTVDATGLSNRGALELPRP
ncbi:MAG TPA: hypothetical protein VG713_03145 [Pirellulales bacterium]|nr:hypothetical protein [Pirellulales bacterium]